MKRYIVCNDQGTPIYVDDDIDRDEAFILCCPFAMIQGLLQQNFNNSFSSLCCEDGTILVFQQHSSLYYIAVSDEGDTEHFLYRQLLTLHELLKLKFGSAVERLVKREEENSRLLRRFVHTLQYLFRYQQSYLVQSIERMDVNDEINAKCIRSLESAIGHAPRNHGALHSLLMVDAKLLAHYAQPKAFDLSTADILLISAYIKSVFNPPAKTEKIIASNAVPTNVSTCSTSTDPKYSMAGGKIGVASGNSKQRVFFRRTKIRQSAAIPTSKVVPHISENQSSSSDRCGCALSVDSGNNECTTTFNVDDSTGDNVSFTTADDVSVSSACAVEGMSIGPSIDVVSSGTFVSHTTSLEDGEFVLAREELHVSIEEESDTSSLKDYDEDEDGFMSMTSTPVTGDNFACSASIRSCPRQKGNWGHGGVSRPFRVDPRNINPEDDPTSLGSYDRGDSPGFYNGRGHERRNDNTKPGNVASSKFEKRVLSEVVYLRSPQYHPYLLYCMEVAPSTVFVVICDVQPAAKSEHQKESLRAMQVRITESLGDFVDFLAVKGHRNITMLPFLNIFPGLVHFIYVDRLKNHLISPTITALQMLNNAKNSYNNNTNNSVDTSETTSEGLGYEEDDASVSFLRRKVWELCWHAQNYLSQGYLAMSTKEGDFHFNYFLWFEDNEGTLLSVEKPLPQLSKNVYDCNFYRDLTRLLFPTFRSVQCYEIYTLHLAVVPTATVAAHHHRLIAKLRSNKSRMAHINLL